MLEAEFDRFAEEYDRQHTDNIKLSGERPEFFHRYKIEDVVAVCRRIGLAPRRILDFGAGVGNSLAYLRQGFPDSEIVLLDPSARSLDIARSRFPGEADFRTFDGHNIPFETGYFDLVFTACVFHHIPPNEHVPLLGEIRRVMSSGGSFFIFEHNPYNPLTVHAVNTCPFDENAVLIGARTLRKRLATAGFQNAGTTYRIFFPRTLSELRPLEKFLAKLPLGAQYYVHVTKRD